MEIVVAVSCERLKNSGSSEKKMRAVRKTAVTYFSLAPYAVVVAYFRICSKLHHILQIGLTVYKRANVVHVHIY